MKTKEEIAIKRGLYNYFTGNADEKVIQAMEEYAAQFQPQWIKINSEADLPKGIVQCHVFDDDGDTGYYTFGIFDDFVFIKENGVTHYQPIVKPSPPIY